MIDTDFPLVNMVIENRTYGKVWALDNKDTLVLHNAGFGYLFDEMKSYHHLLDFLNTQENLPNYLHIYNPTKELIYLLKKDKRFNIRIRKRIQLKYNSIRKFKAIDTPDELVIEKINHSNIKKIPYLNKDIINKFWNEEENFIKEGLGYLVTVNSSGVPIAYCLSAGVDNFKKVEIDILTDESYRMKGLGKLVTYYFVNHCIEKGLIPHWDCFQENIASCKLAKRIGFTSYNEYLFLSIFCKNRV